MRASVGGACLILTRRLCLLTPPPHPRPLTTQRTYLPGSLVALECEQELLLLLWTFAHHSRAFLRALLASPELADVLMAVCYCVLSWASDAPNSSLVHLCILTLLVISAEPGFGAAAQAPCPHSLPLRGRAARATSASLADLVVGAAAEVMLGGHGRLESVHPAALAVLANVTPHAHGLSADATARLLQCLGLLTAPRYLLAAPARRDRAAKRALDQSPPHGHPPL